MQEYCFVTRDSMANQVEIYPVEVGIRKFKGCIQYGAAWDRYNPNIHLYRGKPDRVEKLSDVNCRKRFGFYPQRGEAWFVSGKKRTKIDLAFSP